MNLPKLLNPFTFSNLNKENPVLRKFFSTRRKYPVDPTLADELPVLKLERRNEYKTSLHVWGTAEHGALGIYTQKKSKMRNRGDRRFLEFNRPVRMTFGEINNVVDIAAGFGFSLLVVRTGSGDKLFGTGINSDSQIGFHAPRRNAPLGLVIAPAPIRLPSDNKNCKIVSISAGRAHSVIVTDKLGAFTFGNNAYGQCGRRVIQQEKYEGNQIVHSIPELNREKIAHAVCGMDHTLLLTETGRVYGCGWSADGQTGLGHYNSTEVPTLLEGDIKGEKIVKIASKADCSLALNDKGEVFGWGNSEYSQLTKEGDPRQQINVPCAIEKCNKYGKVVDIAASGSHCLLLNGEGEVYSWGYGLLGQGPKASHSWYPQLIPPILFGKNEFNPDAKVVAIDAGISFNAAITNCGDVYTWGKNKGSCLGLGDKKDKFFPLRVCLGLRALKTSLGVDHVLCLTRT